MGQQQLLLLVLGVVLVGIAVVAGIQVVSEGRRKAALDNDITQTVAYSGLATAWRLKLPQLGGGAGDANSAGLTLASLGVPEDALITETDNYQAAQIRPGFAVAIWYRVREASGPAIEVWDQEHGIKVTHFLYGTTPACQVFRHAFWNSGHPSWTDFYVTPGWDYVPTGIPPAPAGCTW